MTIARSKRILSSLNSFSRFPFYNFSTIALAISKFIFGIYQLHFARCFTTTQMFSSLTRLYFFPTEFLKLLVLSSHLYYVVPIQSNILASYFVTSFIHSTAVVYYTLHTLALPDNSRPLKSILNLLLIAV